MATLWGNPQNDRPSGTLVKLPAGFAGTVRSYGATFRAVVIQGRPRHHVPGKTDVKIMEPGGYFSSRGASTHRVTCGAGEESVLYVRAEGKFEVIPAQPEK